MRPRHHHRSYVPASYSWIRGAAIIWLIFGTLMMWLFTGALLAPAPPPSPANPNAIKPEYATILFGFFGILFTVIPIGLLAKTRWSYYGGIGLAAVCMMAFPIGTVLGMLTIRAFGDGKAAFGIR